MAVPSNDSGIAPEQQRSFIVRWFTERELALTDEIAKPIPGFFEHFRFINYDYDGNARDDLSVKRYDRDKNKYMNPAGKGSVIYSPHPDSQRSWQDADDVWLAEGEGKTLALAQLGVPVLGVRGCNSWSLKGSKDLHPVVARLVQPGKQVNIIFDADWRTNIRVHRGLYDCMDAIRALGGIPVAVNVPALPGMDDTGIDDLIAMWRRSGQDNAEVLRQLSQLDRLQEIDNPYVVNFKEPYPTAENFMQSVYGNDTFLNWQGEFHQWVGHGWRPVHERLIRKGLVEFVRDVAPNITPTPTKINTVLCALADVTVEDIPSAPHWRDGTGVDPAMLVPLENGLLDTKSGELLDHTPEFFNTNWSEVVYDAKAECPKWEQFLTEIYPGDTVQQETLQEFMGYTLTSDTSQQKAIALIGCPRSGKGTITTILEALLGTDGSVSTQWGTLGERFGLANWIGKRAGIIPDARNSPRSNNQSIVERILTITGEDSQSVDRKYLDSWRGKLATRIWLISNQVPATRDTGAAFVNRFIVLEHTVSFKGREDTGLKAALKAELPGILNWCLAGLSRLRERGYFRQPDAGKELIDEWERMNSPLLGFVREQCETGPGMSVPKADLRLAYAQYLEFNDVAAKLPSEAMFTKDLRSALNGQLDTSQKRLKKVKTRCYDGIRLK